MSESLLLLGRDYPELGPLGVANLSQGGAVALSRGARPKPYPHVDPNEDAALVISCSAGRLLAVADAFNGALASEVAIEAVQARSTRLLDEDFDAFRSHMIELVAHASRALSSSRSRSCLIIAALTRGVCHWSSLGDSCLFRASRSEPVSPENPFLIGPGGSVDPAQPELWSGRFTPQPGERIAAVTDGVTNFTSDAESIARALATPADDAAVARSIAETALKGGAGDNVAVATLRAVITDDA